LTINPNFNNSLKKIKNDKNLKWLLLVSLTVVACNSEDAVQVEKFI
jgi:hypothetical protein